MNPRRLTRSRDRMLAGVAGGMAEYLDIDPTVIRILWVIVGIASGGLAILAYIILALVMPQAGYAPAPGGWAPPAQAPIGGWEAGTNPGTYAGTNPGTYAGTYAVPQAPARPESRGIGAGAVIGAVLIVFGGLALADAVLPGWAAGAIMGPALVLALGAGLLVASLRRRPTEVAAAAGASAPAPSYAAPSYASPAYETPSVPGMPEAPATPWDTTDTQTVNAIVPEASDQDARPA